MRQVVFLLLFSSALLAQSVPPESARQSADAPVAAEKGTSQQPSPATDDHLARMRDDLAKLESLNLNMSTEIEFLRDQNLQILLRTNVQMWTILLRDLRGQIDGEEQRRAGPQAPEAKPHP
jgi:hypothetical protein